MADSDDFDRDDSPVDEAPRPKNNMLTVALLLLNVVAALAFVYLLVMDYTKRQEWSYAIFLHDLAAQGLPLEADEAGPTGAYEAVPRAQLTSEQIKAALTKRGGNASGNLAAVEETLHSRITKGNLTPEMLKEHFGEATDVKTQEQEIQRLKKEVPEKLEAAAVATLASAKDDAEKRKLLEKLLLSLAFDVYQVKQLNARVKGATEDELDAMLKDAALRRMYVDLLVPMELYRAGNTPSFVLTKAADRDSYQVVDKDKNPVLDRKALDVDELRKLFDRHMDSLAGKLDATVHVGNEWTTMERRRAIAFFLTDLAFLKKPGIDEPNWKKVDESKLSDYFVYPNGIKRAQAVVGLYEFPAAVQNLTEAWNAMDRQVLAAIRSDRDGIEGRYKADGKKFLLPGFASTHENEILRLQDIQRHLQKAEDRLVKLAELKKDAIKHYEERKKDEDVVMKKLLAARQKTFQQMEELRKLQAELYEAQNDLAEAAERNFELEEQIRKREGSKGAKTP